MSDITYVPYTQTGEPPRRAALARVDFDLRTLSDNDVQVLGHLSEAVDLMNPILRDQANPSTERLLDFVDALRAKARCAQSSIIANYRTILILQNGPFAHLPRKNHLLGLPEHELLELAEKAGRTAELAVFKPLLCEGLNMPDKAGYYPDDLTDDEYQALGAANVVNSAVQRVNGKPHVVLNEDLYKKTLQPAIRHLEQARDLSTHAKFRIYLDAKIAEMKFGSAESRRLADYLWISHGSPIDVIISSAVEVYLDNWKNARGEASGNLYVENAHSQNLLNSLVDLMPFLETNAPWTHRKKEVVRETLPKLRFVDVLNWSGGYISSPATVLAQSLPNDDWVTANLGSVNLVYLNTSKAIFKITGSKLSDEFLTANAVADYGELMFDAQQIHNAMHELGHTSGALDPKLGTGKQARDYLEAEYSALEEARAELFGIWGMTQAAKKGVISEKTAIAGHYSMLTTMIAALKFEPAQAHNKARNMMWHFFRQGGGIEERNEGGSMKYEIKLARLDELVAEMLGQIANIKAAGDKAGAAAFREKWCFTDPLRADVEARTAQLPLGRGLIFPRLKKSGDHYLKELEYPNSFEEQDKFKIRLSK